MADRKLDYLFPEAYKPLSIAEADSFVCEAVKRYGPIDTFFGLPVYRNPVGIEVEVENFGQVDEPPLYWGTTDDQSLKQHGAELVSTPLRSRNIDYALYELSTLASKNTWKFSHRTSVHVHCNVSEYTKYQLRALMAIYACMEEMYFSFVNDFRRGNTFCYRLVGTPAEVVFYTTDKEGSNCTKYCAFNIQPVRRQLTVEFRHLEGTSDVKKLRRWIQLCAKLVGYVQEIPAKACTEQIIDTINEGRMVKLIRDILGDTGEAIFSERQIAESVNNGAFWALALLTRDC